MKENQKQIYSTNSDFKAVFVERFSGTNLDQIKEPMFIEGTACWLNHLENALDKYNNCVHGTTKMTPIEMSTKTNTIQPKGKNNNTHNKPPRFKVGDFVRVPD